MDQLSLTTEWVDLSDEEKVERGLSLANLIREAQLLDDEHAERKKDMKKERETVEAQIAALATIVRTGVCARSVFPVPVGPMRRTLLFCSSTSPRFLEISRRL